MAIYSCKDCGDRFPGCHRTCEKYKADKAKHDELKAKIDFAKKVDSGLYLQRNRAVGKATRGNNGYKLNGRKGG